MSKRVLLLLILIVILSVTGCGGGLRKAATVTGKPLVIQDDVLLFQGKENNNGDLYWVRDNAERKKIASDVMRDSFILLEDSKAILYLDKEHVLYYQEDGKERQMITSEVRPFSIVLSADRNAFAYLKGDSYDLYIQRITEEGLQDRIKVDSNIDLYNYTFSDDGTILLYIDSDESLNIKEGEKVAERIASNVSRFYLGGNNKVLAYLNADYDIYIRNLLATDNRKISGVKNVVQVKVSNDSKTVMFLADYSSSFKGELYYIKEEGEPQWIASDVMKYQMSEDGKQVTYINEDGNLFYRDIEKGDSEKLASDVYNFLANTTVKQMAYLDDKNTLYFINYPNKAVRVSDDVTTYSVLHNKLIYLNKDKNFFIKKVDAEAEKIAESVVEYTFSPNETTIAYYNENDEIFIKVQDQGIEKLNEDSNKFTQIYLVNNLLFQRLLKLSDITGFWVAKDEEEYLFEIKQEGEIIGYSYDGQGTLKVRLRDEEENTATMVVTFEDDSSDESYVKLHNKDKLVIDDKEFNRITKEELDKILETQRIEAERAAERAEKEERAREVAYQILYEWIYVDEGTECRVSPSADAEVVGNLNQATDWYVEDTYVDGEFRVWAKIEIYHNGYYRYVWFIYHQ